MGFRERLDKRSASQWYKIRDLHVVFQQSLQSCQRRQISPEDLCDVKTSSDRLFPIFGFVVLSHIVQHTVHQNINSHGEVGAEAFVAGRCYAQQSISCVSLLSAALVFGVGGGVMLRLRTL